AFFFEGPDDSADLHSFPTRRSSDLRGDHHGAVEELEARAVLEGHRHPGRLLGNGRGGRREAGVRIRLAVSTGGRIARRERLGRRSEEHTSELQSQSNLVCRLLLEKK